MRSIRFFGARIEKSITIENRYRHSRKAEERWREWWNEINSMRIRSQNLRGRGEVGRGLCRFQQRRFAPNLCTDLLVGETMAAIWYEHKRVYDFNAKGRRRRVGTT